MSAALCLVHEMGHAAQQLDGEEIRSTKNSAYLKGEENNLNKYEIPIAKELGEPTRRCYADSKNRVLMNNSTHYRTRETCPYWWIAAPLVPIWYWWGLSQYAVDHNG